jgi:hypothetical protein
MTYLSNVNLRAVLAVLVQRAGGEVLLSNEEFYDAMMPAAGGTRLFAIDETPTGIRISMVEGRNPLPPEAGGSSAE